MTQKEKYMDFDDYIHEYELSKLDSHSCYRSQTEKSPEESARMVNEWIQCSDNFPPLPSKCKKCTSEEIAVLRIIQNEPAATNHYIAFEIGKSERAILSIISHLVDCGILKKEVGERTSFWQIVCDELEVE